MNNEEIADSFAKYFEKCYSCNNEKRAEELRQEYETMRANYHGLPLPELKEFNTELVSQVILDLKRGKAPGLDGLGAEHLFYAHPIVSVILSRLFGLILLNKHVPDGFMRNYIVPLPKLSNVRAKNVTCDDFRGIAISCIISKVFEYCFLKRFDKLLRSSDCQFGFKKNLGCSHAILSVRKLVNQMINNGCTANICSLDLSKAFDKVNHCALYIKLMKRYFPVDLLELLENWINNCSSCVKWRACYSEFFRVSFGVRQGSVLSPFLFAVYIDDIIDSRDSTSNSEIIMYADDILLIASSVCKLQQMLNRCELELEWLDMSINVNKSHCIRIGNRYNVGCANLTTRSCLDLKWVCEIRYLGTNIINCRHFKCSFSQAKSSFYRSVNAIFCKVGRSASEEVFIHLIYSKCVPILIYGLECFELTNTDIKSIDFPVMRLLMKFFKTTDIAVINECILYLNIELPSKLIAKRYVKLANKYSCSTNKFCRYLHMYAN